MQFHTYTQTSSHIHAFRHIVGMHTCTRAHDYAHVHAIKIFHTCMQKHMLTTKCTRARMSKCTHVCTHTHMHALPPSHIPYACSLVMSHLTIYLQVTINSFTPEYWST